MALTDVSGINVREYFLAWFHGEFADRFAERFPGKSMTFVLLNPEEVIESLEFWYEPENYEEIVAHIGDEEAATAPDGTLENVHRKLRFSLRTMMDSGDAKDRPDLVREGDFPFEGAGEHERYYGGVSGLTEKLGRSIIFAVHKLDAITTLEWIH